jgi:hypothetical protein
LSSEQLRYTVHDDLPAEESRLVDTGLGIANAEAAPLHKVQPLSCFARLASNQVVGGAVASCSNYGWSLIIVEAESPGAW